VNVSIFALPGVAYLIHTRRALPAQTLADAGTTNVRQKTRKPETPGKRIASPSKGKDL